MDRLIRLQNFVTSSHNIQNNEFCGALTRMSDENAVNHLINFFSFDLEKMRTLKTKTAAIQYLVERVESKSINICQGVLVHKILPTWQVVDNSVYKNTSGFVVKDDKIPFIFLPGDINPEETEGRQIFTLIYLLFIIGYEKYSYFMDRDFQTKALTSGKDDRKLLMLTSEVLFPKEITKNFNNLFTENDRDEMSSEYKITPSAVVVTLLLRKNISIKRYREIKPKKYIPIKTTGSPRRGQKIENAIRKFCGKYSFKLVNGSLRRKTLKKTQAQYLLFGAINKKGFKKYCINLKL